jgi:hypothetical protein
MGVRARARRRRQTTLPRPAPSQGAPASHDRAARRRRAATGRDDQHTDCAGKKAVVRQPHRRRDPQTLPTHPHTNHTPSLCRRRLQPTATAGRCRQPPLLPPPRQQPRTRTQTPPRQTPCLGLLSVLLRLDSQSLIDGLLAHFRRSGFQVESVGGLMVEVQGRDDAASHAQARNEVLMHLRVWQAANPGAQGGAAL